MRGKCLVEEVQGRELDSYDLINVLGPIKESDFKGGWRNYSPGGKPGAKINFFFSTESYYVETTMESFPSLALSPKYQASPHLMQALLRRLLCGHRHGLILEKLRSYEVPIADGSQLNLSCSVGTAGVDMVVNRSPSAPEYRFRKFGTGEGGLPPPSPATSIKKG